MSTQHSGALQPLGSQTNSIEIQHDDAITLEGLEHVFRWASEIVSEGEDTRVKIVREKRLRRQVLEIVQKFRENKLLAESKDETAYLQRRVIALLQKLQEVIEESAAAKQIIVNQYYALQRVPELERQIDQLKAAEFEREAAVTERRYLMNALAKIKTERDFLEEVLIINETENERLALLLKESRAKIAKLKIRKWWHLLFPKKKKAI